jgi:hypothetical protein
MTWYGRARSLVPLTVMVLLVLQAAACRERPREPDQPARPSRAELTSALIASSAASSQAIEASRPFRFAAAARVVAVGDLHGDLAATRSVLRLAGAIDEQDRWVGGKLVLVQTGDQLDRGDDERAIVDLLDRLAEEASAAGGAVHVLNGNHEVMNVAGDFRYVTPGGFADFADVKAEGRVARLAMRVPETMRGRAHAFFPGGAYALRLAQRNTVVVVGRTVYVHGGVLPAHVRYGLGRLNEEIRRWMSGDSPDPPPILDGENSPVWTRRYSHHNPSGAACAELAEVLNRLKVDRMVVGHTVQRKGISSACDDRVWRIDVGLARHYGGTISALEIAQGHARVLTPSE